MQEPNMLDLGGAHGTNGQKPTRGTPPETVFARMQPRTLRPAGHDIAGLPGVRAYRSTEAGYPRLLLALPDRPPVIYVAGELLPSDEDSIAVVGSRRANARALDEAAAIGRALAERRWTVVSGLADGVDSAAHRGALLAPVGRTIAVVGTGLDMTFPAHNAALDREIRSRGAVVSQFAAGAGPSRTSFPARNALIAALSRASVIVVAEERSGTRIELDHALAQGKPVVFWGPLMGDERWAREFVAAGIAIFADTVDDVLNAVC